MRSGLCMRRGKAVSLAGPWCQRARVAPLVRQLNLLGFTGQFGMVPTESSREGGHQLTCEEAFRLDTHCLRYGPFIDPQEGPSKVQISHLCRIAKFPL